MKKSLQSDQLPVNSQTLPLPHGAHTHALQSESPALQSKKQEDNPQPLELVDTVKNPEKEAIQLKGRHEISHSLLFLSKTKRS